MTAKDCGAVQAPVNGSYVGSKTTFPNQVQFSCDVGFVLSGASVRRCLANGSWSGEITSCTGERHKSCSKSCGFVRKCSVSAKYVRLEAETVTCAVKLIKLTLF